MFEVCCRSVTVYDVMVYDLYRQYQRLEMCTAGQLWSLDHRRL